MRNVPKLLFAALGVLVLAIIAVAVWLGASTPEPAPVWDQPEHLAELPSATARAQLPGWYQAPAADGWTMQLGDPSSSRFSPLADITTANVGSLQVAFTFDTNNNRGHEAAPLVVGGTMYVTTPYPNDVYALDLTRPGQPIKWHYQPKPLPASQGVACCDVVNRGAFFDGGRLFLNTLDGQSIALDASGRELWRVKIAEINRGETITMAPLVAEGRVLVGTSGGELGVRGALTALDAGSGAVVWKAYSTGPDSDVLIGPEFQPFYPRERGTDLGVHSWNPEGWKIGGGNPWAGSAMIRSCT